MSVSLAFKKVALVYLQATMQILSQHTPAMKLHIFNSAKVIISTGEPSLSWAMSLIIFEKPTVVKPIIRVLGS